MNAVAPEQPESDAALAAAYRAGEESAAAELVRRHAARLARFLYAAGAEPDQVEDLVQETFLRAFRRIESWRGESSFRAWLLAIAANRLRDERRRNRGRRIFSIGQRDFVGRSDPEGELLAGDTERALRRGLQRLPRLQREVFLLRAQQGLSYDDIAGQLGTTAGAARVHYHQAVRRLKELVR